MKLTPAFVTLVAIVAALVVALAALKQLPSEAATLAIGVLVGLLVPSKYVGGIALFVALSATACAPHSAGNAAKAAVYVAELEMCVESAASLEESRLCRCEVNTRWQRPCTPAFVPDGGARD